MPDATEFTIELSAGPFRLLRWDGEGVPALLLHGLTGLAEVWTPAAQALAGGRGLMAMDQRGHGDSPAPADGYDIERFVDDLAEAVKALGFERPHLVGHSMGARVAMVAAARRPELFRSVAVVDIGPEAWEENWRETVAGIERMPESFTREESLTFFTRNRPTPSERLALYLVRLREGADGRLSWRGSPEAWKTTVVSHRSRDFWADWEALSLPALLIRGGSSNELRPEVATEMRTRNPGVAYLELPGIGHNVPLLAPEQLAEALAAFWSSVESPGS